jgi:hypothetical protein
MTTFLLQRSDGAVIDVERLWLALDAVSAPAAAHAGSSAAITYGVLVGVRLSRAEPLIADALLMTIERLAAAESPESTYAAESVEVALRETLERALDAAVVVAANP